MDTTNKPDIKPFDWILIGPKSYQARHAVVVKVFEEPSEVLGEIQAVYLDEAKRAIYDSFVRKDDLWHFHRNGPSGGYADHKDYFRSFVELLRRGPYRDR